MITRETADTKQLLTMMISGYVAYDPVWKVVLTTTRGRVRQGNARRYFVQQLERRYNPYARQWYNARIDICGFRAADDDEAIAKLHADKRVEAHYASLWQRAFTQLIGEG